jgi:hypothetical protein
LACEDVTPVVFWGLVIDAREVENGAAGGPEASDGTVRPPFLQLGGTLREPFRPSELRVTDSGRLYHPVTQLPRLRGTMGLVGAPVGLRLGLDFVCLQTEEEERSGRYQFEWEGTRHVIPKV